MPALAGLYRSVPRAAGWVGSGRGVLLTRQQLDNVLVAEGRGREQGRPAARPGLVDTRTLRQGRRAPLAVAHLGADMEACVRVCRRRVRVVKPAAALFRLLARDGPGGGGKG